jgi:hypothetical protein
MFYTMVDLDLIIVFFLATPPDWFLPSPNLVTHESEADKTMMKLDNVPHMRVRLEQVEVALPSELISRSESMEEEESSGSLTSRPQLIPTESQITEEKHISKESLSTSSDESNLSFVKTFIFKEIRKPSKGNSPSSLIEFVFQFIVSHHPS